MTTRSESEEVNQGLRARLLVLLVWGVGRLASCGNEALSSTWGSSADAGSLLSIPQKPYSNPLVCLFMTLHVLIFGQVEKWNAVEYGGRYIICTRDR